MSQLHTSDSTKTHRVRFIDLGIERSYGLVALYKVRLHGRITNRHPKHNHTAASLPYAQFQGEV